MIRAGRQIRTASAKNGGAADGIEAMDMELGARMAAVDRAAVEFRRGLGVVIETGGSAVLAQSVETATADTLAAFSARGNGEGRLALTGQRAETLGLAGPDGGIVTLPLQRQMDSMAIRRLTDPTFSGPAILLEAGETRTEAPGSGAAAAIGLAKLAQLLPAALVAPIPDATARRRAAWAVSHDLRAVDASAIHDYPRLAAATLRPVSEARVPLAAAEDARVIAFRPADGSVEQLAIMIGEPATHQPVLCRLHGACFTGDLLGSLRCDCGPQLQDALRIMGEAGHGVLLYLAHEGRGIGLINKLRAYQLQDRGLDTMDANLHLGFEPDERSFDAAAVMLGHLGIASVRLLTNNPSKVAALERAGVAVVERVPHITSPNRHNRGYLSTKARRAGHLLENEVEP